MKIKHIFLSVMLLNLCGFSLWAQDANLTKLVKKIDEATSKYAQEKVYLHLDKPYYAIGDDIWFKAYTIDARTGLPSLRSRTLSAIRNGSEGLWVVKRIYLPACEASLMASIINF